MPNISHFRERNAFPTHTKITYSFQDPAYRNKAREEGLKKDLEKHPELADIIVRP
ncbi:MAG: hypothetical protein IJ717_01240 [Treponema sp.]|nr:hypothetical protein [Treponema sp.]